MAAAVEWDGAPGGFLEMGEALETRAASQSQSGPLQFAQNFAGIPWLHYDYRWLQNPKHGQGMPPAASVGGDPNSAGSVPMGDLMQMPAQMMMPVGPPGRLRPSSAPPPGSLTESPKLTVSPSEYQATSGHTDWW